MKPSLVLWDWNGTLLDDVALCVDALNRLLRIYHYPQQYSLTQYREILASRLKIIIFAQVRFSKNSYKELADDYMQDYLARAGACPLAESAVPALSLLKGAGVQQVILSASNLPVLEQQVTERGVRPYFDRLLGLDNIYARSKVEVGLAYLTELKQRGAVPAQAIMIGDSVHDLRLPRRWACGVCCKPLGIRAHSSCVPPVPRCSGCFGRCAVLPERTVTSLDRRS